MTIPEYGSNAPIGHEAGRERGLELIDGKWVPITQTYMTESGAIVIPERSAFASEHRANKAQEVIDYPYPIIRKRIFINKLDAISLLANQPVTDTELEFIEIKTVNPCWINELFLSTTEPNDD